MLATPETPAALLQLQDLPRGTIARVAKVNGGQSTTRKLLGLGLRIGSEIEMVHQRGQGIVVASAGNRIALGLAVAEQIWAEPLN